MIKTKIHVLLLLLLLLFDMHVSSQLG